MQPIDESVGSDELGEHTPRPPSFAPEMVVLRLVKPEPRLATSAARKGSDSCLISCVLSDQVVHETIDGETVVINLATGNYYSIEGSGADLWSRLLAGETADESGSHLASEHRHAIPMSENSRVLTALLPASR